MPFELPNLPFAKDALEPHMSAATFDYHHGKHHAAYVNKLNGLIDGTNYASQSLEEIIQNTSGKADAKGIFNNAAQIWNHSFFWQSMTPNGGGKPTGELLQRIEKDFGSFDAFKDAFKAAGVGQFGSGWAWLVLDGDTLKIVTTANAETPITDGLKPLITCDVWEHAYYIDYRNDRPGFLGVFLDHLANWEFAAQQL